jgi:hypothetical protein
MYSEKHRKLLRENQLAFPYILQEIMWLIGTIEFNLLQTTWKDLTANFIIYQTKMKKISKREQNKNMQFTCLQGIPFKDSTRRGLKIIWLVSPCPQHEYELLPHVNTCKVKWQVHNGNKYWSFYNLKLLVSIPIT